MLLVISKFLFPFIKTIRTIIYNVKSEELYVNNLIVVKVIVFFLKKQKQ
jgi:hypothetical protein